MNEPMQIDGNRDMLKRIIALLFAMANLADNAARLPYPLRWLVLWHLRWGEPVARGIVIREARRLRTAPWLLSSAEAHRGNDPEDAISLGLCFRLLALALTNLSALSKRSWKRDTTDQTAPSVLLFGHFIPALQAPDTS